jgi:hypothetical protein
MFALFTKFLRVFFSSVSNDEWNAAKSTEVPKEFEIGLIHDLAKTQRWAASPSPGKGPRERA